MAGYDSGMSEFFGALGAAIVLAILWVFLVSWPVMLLFGAVHSFLPIVPAFGFGETIAILLLVRLLLGIGFSADKD